MKVKIGLIQSRPTADRSKNLEHTLVQIGELKHKGAQIIAVSELFLAPYFCQVEDKRFFEWAEPIPGTITERLSAAAKEHGVVLAASLYERDPSGALYNTAVVFDADGSFRGKYRKTHIPDDLKNYYGERFYFKAGDLGYPVFKTKFGCIGVLICWDQWFPEAARALAKNGAQIIFYPTAIGYQVGLDHEQNQKEREAWITIQRSHAIANGVFVASINRVGREDHLDFWGSSFVCDSLGHVLASADDKAEKLVLATCDLDEIEKTREDWPFLKALRKDVY